MAVSKTEAAVILAEFNEVASDFMENRLKKMVGDNYSFTIVARCKDEGIDGDIVVSEDDLEKVAAALVRRCG
jgi:hypothetical protein